MDFTPGPHNPQIQHHSIYHSTTGQQNLTLFVLFYCMILLLCFLSSARSFQHAGSWLDCEEPHSPEHYSPQGWVSGQRDKPKWALGEEKRPRQKPSSTSSARCWASAKPWQLGELEAAPYRQKVPLHPRAEVGSGRTRHWVLLDTGKQVHSWPASSDEGVSKRAASSATPPKWTGVRRERESFKLKGYPDRKTRNSEICFCPKPLDCRITDTQEKKNKGELSSVCGILLIEEFWSSTGNSFLFRDKRAMGEPNPSRRRRSKAQAEHSSAFPLHQSHTGMLAQTPGHLQWSSHM